MAFKMNARSPLMKKLVGDQPNLPEGLREAIEASTPNKMMDSPAKMNKGERYDMKMASDQNLTASARKNYAENAEAAQKSAPTKKVIGPEKSIKKVKATAPKARNTVGGKSSVGMSASDVPKNTSFGGMDYKLARQDGAGAHYYNEGFNPADGKKGTIKRAGDDGIYHVSRSVEKPVELKNKKANIISAANMKKPKAKPTGKQKVKNQMKEIKKPTPPKYRA